VYGESFVEIIYLNHHCHKFYYRLVFYLKVRILIFLSMLN